MDCCEKDEFESVLHQYEGMGLNVKGVDASARFLNALKGYQILRKKEKQLEMHLLKFLMMKPIKLKM